MSRSKNKENILRCMWRPAMAWSYFAICLWDFLFAPIFFAWYSHYTGTTFQPWKPLTLGENGMYHVAMGAIVGVSAWSRGKEKIAHIETNKPQEKNDTAS